MRNPVLWAVAVALGLAASCAPARADEETIPLKKVPEAVRRAVKEKFPEAKIKKAAREEDDGKTVYEITLIEDEDDEDDDETIDVSLKPDGTILEIEETIEEEDLPRKVLAAVKRWFSKAEIEKAEKVTKGGKVTYEVLLEADDEGEDEEEKLEVVLDRSGKILSAKQVDEDEDEGENEKKEGKKEGKTAKEKD
jgi:hypothetical protein